MEYSTPSQNHPSHCKPNKLIKSSKIKDTPYNKFLSEYQYHTRNTCNKNNNSNIQTDQSLKLGRREDKSNYDTLDSAYNTGESSYNTVDSSYFQNSISSGYNTLESKSNYDLRNNKEDFQETEPFVNQQIAGLSSSDFVEKTFNIGDTEFERIKFADESDTSDTATETETDTEVTFSNCTTESNMSYVPDYIRPIVGPVSFASVTTTTTSSYITSRPIRTSTVTSPSLSVSSSAMTSPAGSMIDLNIALSPKATNYNRTDRKLSYAGYREDYVLKQKEKLCGRKSLEERLKSLEAGAAVKLKVCKGSQNRRKRSEAGEMVAKLRSMSRTAMLYSRQQSPVQNIEENVFKEDKQVEATPTRAPHPPDIIEAHQPPVRPQDLPLLNKMNRSASITDTELMHSPSSQSIVSEPTRESTSSKSSESSSHVKTPSTSLGGSSNCSEAPPEKSQELRDFKLELLPVESEKRRNDLKIDKEDIIKTELPDEEPSELPLVPISVEPPAQSPAADSTVSKPIWKPPSQEALDRLIDTFEAPKSPPAEVKTPPLSQPVVQITVDEPKAAKPVVRREGAIQRRGAPGQLMIDVTTKDAVVPVELRSPRNEAAGFSRVNMRENRRARVFVLPSSDDSESDNLLSKLNNSTENRTLHVAPVKFVPSVLRRSQSKSARAEESPSSSASSSVADGKAGCIALDFACAGEPNEDNVSSAFTTSKVQRRKSSRSPKRSNSKRSSRSKSSHDRTSTEKKRARTFSTGGQPIQSISNRDQNNRAPNTASRFTLESDLSSPRQIEVAQAVKFGFAGNEGAIPYMDDINSPDDVKAIASIEPLKDADDATIKKAHPLVHRGRSSKKKEGPRRTSYMEAMDSSDDLTPDPDTDGSGYGRASTEDGREHYVPLGKYGRSNSADSVLSTTEVQPEVVLRKHPRASSADRNSLKGVHRRSYQIATNTIPTDSNALLRPSPHKRQPSMKKIKNFFAENTPHPTDGQPEEGRWSSRSRSIGSPATIILNEYDDTVAREGFLYFKVATIEKGKRTSAQKSWKLVWVVLKEQSLYLCKDWSRNKMDSAGNFLNNNSPGSVNLPSKLALEEEEPLNIQGSLLSIAYNYVKRKNVFKVTTHNGSEYLFQAEYRDLMLDWINSIQVSGNHDNKDGQVTINEDLILKKTNEIESGPKTDKRGARKSRSPKPTRRAAVPIKDVDGSRRFKWRGSVNRIVRKFGQGHTLMQGGTFDVHLEDCPPSANNELIPFVVDLCCRIVDERGLSFTGIYRVPGNSGTLSALQEELNARGADAVDLENDERFCELNVVSSLLKSFFRKLPDPLFTNDLYDDFINMNRRKDPEERLNGLRRLIHMLPPPHYETLKFLITHLRRVADNSEYNKMEVRNLAIVFGPTLVRSTVSDNMATMVTDMSDQCRIVESVLNHAAWFFADDESHNRKAQKPPIPNEIQHEPVPNIDHLLANVGRTPGDVSDSASESSKSKASCASEKESFTRDVMEVIFGTGKKWKQNALPRDVKVEDDQSSDDEFGFKEALRNQTKTPTDTPKTPPPANNATLGSSTYQVGKPAATGIKADWTNKGQHLPPDIPARLYEFYVENLERLARTDLSRPLPYLSSSSTETSPQVTPRTSLFGLPQPPSQRNYQLQSQRSSDGKLQGNSASGSSNILRQSSVPPSPSQHRKVYHHGNAYSGNGLPKAPAVHRPGLAINFSSRSEHHANVAKPVQTPSSQSETSSTGKDDNNEESDSDTSIYIGDTLEEKLKNLTNLDKKLERRPSRRHANRCHDALPILTPHTEPLKPVNRKLTTAPSLQAGERITPDNLHLYPTKKTSKEIYQERKAQRQQHRHMVKSNRSTLTNDSMSRWASDENVFNRFDPKRQVLRSCSHDDGSTGVLRRPHLSKGKDKIKRRHTLGGDDFPAQVFWEQSSHASLQNIYRESPGSATARLLPHYGAYGPLVANNAVSVSRSLSQSSRCRMEKTPKTESYI